VYPSLSSTAIPASTTIIKGTFHRKHLIALYPDLKNNPECLDEMMQTSLFYLNPDDPSRTNNGEHSTATHHSGESCDSCLKDMCSDEKTVS
jgi:hypothetical protein